MNFEQEQLMDRFKFCKEFIELVELKNKSNYCNNVINFIINIKKTNKYKEKEVIEDIKYYVSQNIEEITDGVSSYDELITLLKNHDNKLKENAIKKIINSKIDSIMKEYMKSMFN